MKHLAALVGVFFLVLSSVANGQPSLDCDCRRGVKPVCGSDRVTYSSPCLARCANVSKWTPGRCDCLCIELYAPVCGSDKKTYSNACFAGCAGVSSTPGECPCMCTKEYIPVCGSDGVTYPSRCVAKCSHVTYTPGQCSAPPVRACNKSSECCSGADCKKPKGSSVKQCVVRKTGQLCPPCGQGQTYQGGVCKAAPCRTGSDCGGVPLFCLSPGATLACDVMEHVESPCSKDSQCSKQGRICDKVDCFDGKTCVAGCKSNKNCTEGAFCYKQRCKPLICKKAANCPSSRTFACKSGRCVRKTCRKDTDCAAKDAFCVNKQCFSRRGQCSFVPG